MIQTYLRPAGALVLLALAACTQPDGRPASEQPRVLETLTDPATGQPVIAGPVLKGTAPRTPGKSTTTSSIGVSAGESAAALNTTSPSERAAAAATTKTAQIKLGTTIASLGDPSQPGFWIKTPLIDTNAQGRIVNPANGKSAKVQLIPLGGAPSGGSQVSLPALQLIGVSLTDLPMIEVYRG